MVGVLFTGGEAPQKTEDLLSLCRNADFTAAADSGLDRAAEWEIKVDFFLGDMDSVSQESGKNSDLFKESITFDKDKDYSDTELGLKKLVEAGCTRITVIGGGGGRADHFLAIVELLFKKYPLEAIYAGQSRLVKFSRKLVLTGVPGRTVSFFAGQEPVTVGRSEGLQWELTGMEFRPGNGSLSNRFVQAAVTVELAGGEMVAIEDTDGASEIISRE
jgi:thiamine pyrophosphokinase